MINQKQLDQAHDYIKLKDFFSYPLEKKPYKKKSRFQQFYIEKNGQKYYIRKRLYELITKHEGCACCGSKIDGLVAVKQKADHITLHPVNYKKGLLFNIDHLWPASFGGPNDYWNLQLLCLTCNQKKDNKINIFSLPEIIDNQDHLNSILKGLLNRKKDTNFRDRFNVFRFSVILNALKLKKKINTVDAHSLYDNHTRPDRHPHILDQRIREKIRKKLQKIDLNL